MTEFTGSFFKRASLIAVLSAGAGLMGSMAIAGGTTDFTNPAVAMSNEAMVASGTCIAKYAASLDDPSKPASEIAQLVAKRCSKEISRSAGLASWMVGKPEEFQKTLKYTQVDLTTNTVVRSRAAAARPHAF